MRDFLYSLTSSAAGLVLVALALCTAVLPLIRSAAHRFGIFDCLGPLKIHATPVPRLGGIALVSSMSLATILSRGPKLPTEFWIGLAILWIVSFADDLYPVPPLVRMGAQIASAVALTQIGSDRFFGSTLADFVITCVVVLAFVNAFNFLDGSDGIAAGTAAIIALGLCFAIIPSDSPDLLLGWALIGSCLGFLLFNLPPATIFMGDSGSTTLGLVLAFVAVNSARANSMELQPLLIALLMASVPLADFVLAIFRRLLHLKSVFEGDRQHFYDLLLVRGISPKRVCMYSYSAVSLTTILGWFCRHLGVVPLVLIATFVFSILTAIGLALGSLSTVPRQRHNPAQRLTIPNC